MSGTNQTGEPVAVMNNVHQKLFGGNAELEYVGQEDPARPLSQRWAVLARIVPHVLNPNQPSTNIGLGYGSTFLEAKSAAAEAAYRYCLTKYRKDMEDLRLI